MSIEFGIKPVQCSLYASLKRGNERLIHEEIIVFVGYLFTYSEIKQIKHIYFFPMEVEDLEDLILPRYGLSLHAGKFVLSG